jgi:hypothetical protein
MSLSKIAALYLAKSRFKNKKQVKKQDGGEMTVYEYSDAQVARRNSDKAKRVEKLKGMREKLVKQVKKDMQSSDTLTQLKALAVALIDHTYERVGNEQSAKEGHKGVTGWQKKDIKFLKDKARIKYVGKSGVHQTKFVTDAGALKLLKELCKGKKPGDKLLEKDDVTVDASDVNDYLPEGITAKDLRGLHANEEMKNALKAQRAKGPKLPTDRKEKDKVLKDEFKKALEVSAEAVGHEPSTLRSQYLVPNMEKAYMHDGTVIDKLDKKAATLTPTGEETWSGGTVYKGDVRKDTFVHFTPASRAEQIVKSKKLLMRPPYEKFGTDNVAAISLSYGAYVPGTQTTHIKTKEPLVAILFKTSAKPYAAYVEEVLWNRDVPLQNAKIIPAAKAISMLRNPPEQITDDDQVRYATKSQGEKEEAGDRKMLRKEPKKKPPRQDLRRHKTFDKDTDEDPDLADKAQADKDKDLSRNYKRVALRWAANKAKSEDGAKKLHEDYMEQNPGSDKQWQDFFEKPDDKAKKDDDPKVDKKPKKEDEESDSKAPAKGDESKPEEKPVDPAQEQKALLKQTVNDIKTN